MTKAENQKIEITEYTDYTVYISALIEHKRKFSQFSYRNFCRKSGFKSPNYIRWIIDGVRPISLKSVHKFIAGLALDKREAQYFILMVNYKEAKDPQTKRFYFEQMLSWQKKRVGAFSKDAYEYLSHWYYLAIRELVAANDFQDNPHWIQKRLSGEISIIDIKHSLETLERLKLIERDQKGFWRQTSKNLITKREVTSLAAYNYHTEMLNLAEQVLTKRHSDERHFQSVVALIDKKTINGLKTKIHQFQGELIEYLQQEEQNKGKHPKNTVQELYAVNVQLMPLTAPIKPGE